MEFLKLLIFSARHGDWYLTSDCDLLLEFGISSSTMQELMSFVGHGTPVVSCCFVGSERLCTASQDGIISLWDLTTGHR